jgi:hypothetical protein
MKKNWELSLIRFSKSIYILGPTPAFRCLTLAFSGLTFCIFCIPEKYFRRQVKGLSFITGKMVHSLLLGQKVLYIQFTVHHFLTFYWIHCKPVETNITHRGTSPVGWVDFWLFYIFNKRTPVICCIPFKSKKNEKNDPVTAL